ncbi:hypothetical protein [Micromonospora sp. WMMD737]|uniref:hypothetical protein n=1 Tax=Micromonospora sp. WMMD737 TaxID=3404113 RepID=UPI003B9561E5
MELDVLAPSLLAGAFAIIGGIGGVMISGRIARNNDLRRWKAEDDRRWLADRRKVFASYIVLVEAMLRDIDRIGAFLPYYGDEPISEEDESSIGEDLHEYIRKWDDELQPALLEVQLMAGPRVADLANRVSGGLMEITTPIELRNSFVSYYPGWFQAKDLANVLYEEMRTELGLPKSGLSTFPAKHDPNWPWLTDRPSRESYIQNHPRQHKPDPANSD